MNEMKLERMKISRNVDQEKMMTLKSSYKPILIYGCANHAKVVYNYLKQYGLNIEAFIVDSKYWKENFYIKSVIVRKLDEYIDILDKYNIVIGFCDVDKSKFLMGNSLILKGEFYLFWEPLVIYEWDEYYISDNWNRLLQVYCGLGDILSKRIMSALIDAKLNKDGERMLEYADGRQYFNELTYCIDPKDEIYIDCGAYNGDTILKYAAFTNEKYKKIYAFEPNYSNVLRLSANIMDLPNIEVINKGTWNKNTMLEFEENGSASQIVENGKMLIEVVSIDEIVNDEIVTFIKMDVEGSELESLQGAEKTIKRNMPKLAICCYHKRNDIIDLYNYIQSFNSNDIKYEFYLRHHSNSAYETVLYAIPIKRKK